ncbi:MAG: hypothetical protein KC766_36675 [Myxococcales bacterium]|nr:hypothetical protein [Myxococcales bacterium]
MASENTRGVGGVALLLVAACGAIGCSSDAEDGSSVLADPDLAYAFDKQTIESGYEDDSTCMSWTLNNPEELWVNRVDGFNDGGWHHSNWFFVDEDTYAGPDGAWPCDERDFDTVKAGLAGGVFFAQSTQAKHDIQDFPEGAAFRIPPHSRVVGQVHLLNATPDSIDTGFRFEVRTIPAEKVTEKLHPVSMTNLLLEIPPRSKSRFSLACEFAPAFQEKLGEVPSFDIFYVLPHYHALGSGLRLGLIGGERDGETVFETHGGVGTPLGAKLDPPKHFDGATGFEMSCDYDNPRDDTVGYGIGDQEMCVFLAFTNSPLTLAATSLGKNADGGMQDGMPVFDAPCVPVAVQQD